MEQTPRHGIQFGTLALLLAALVVPPLACGGTGSSNQPPDAASTAGAGGAQGGASGAGGASAGGGGTNPGTGGTGTKADAGPVAGGAGGSAGASGAGGQTGGSRDASVPDAAAGAGGKAGAAGTAGAGGSGGSEGGGGSASGGSVASGGSAGSAGSAGNGGSAGSGGSAGNGGSASGGSAGSAGSAGKGGTGGGGGTSSCTEPPAAGPLLGWASQPGAGYNGTSIPTTTGGGSATPITVTTLAALNSAAGGTNPAVIYVKGVLQAGTVKIGSNKTIAGICGAEIHGHVAMSGSVNVIFRNIKVVGYNCSDSPGECKSGDDAISVVDNAHHIWFDHCDISDGSDGNLDITNGSDFVTVSWTKFSYSTKRTDPVTGATGHRFSNLIGAADGLAIDKGHLNVTWHHNWWADNIAERMPRSRDGKIHVVNNLFTATGNDYCTNSGNLSSLLVENNIYIGVNNPLQEDDDGNMLNRGNVFTNIKGTKTSKGTGFTPPYQLTPDPTTDLEATLRSKVGPQR